MGHIGNPSLCYLSSLEILDPEVAKIREALTAWIRSDSRLSLETQDKPLVMIFDRPDRPLGRLATPALK